MPSIVLRHLSDSPVLTNAIGSLGYAFDRTWTPGDETRKGNPRPNYGFNLCLVDRSDSSADEVLEEAISKLEGLEAKLKPLGQTLRGTIFDVGLFSSPELPFPTIRFSSSHAGIFASLGVAIEVSLYP